MNIKTQRLIGFIWLGVFLSFSPKSEAHCDTLDGPVIKDAVTAIERKDVTPVLKWVKSEDEQIIKQAFQNYLGVQSDPALNQAARVHFYETLVKTHRAGEGEEFDGLKPAGTIEPVIVEADKALESGQLSDLTSVVMTHLNEGISQRFERAKKAKEHANDSVEDGRAYVAAYVDYIHFVEAVDQTLKGSAGHH